METVGIIAIATLLALLCLIAGFALSTMRRLTKTLDGLSARLDKLDVRVGEQEKAVQGLRAQLDARDANPISDVVQIVGRVRQRGVLPTVAAVALSLIRAYLKNRARPRALPPGR